MEIFKNLMDFISLSKETALNVATNVGFVALSVVITTIITCGIASFVSPFIKLPEISTKFGRYMKKNGILYRTHFTPLLYNLVLRPVTGLLSGIASVSFGCPFAYCMASIALGILSVDAYFVFLGLKDEETAELDIYRTFVNLKVQLSTGAYLEDCLSKTSKGCYSARYATALNQMLKDMNNKAMTTSDATDNFSSSFCSPMFAGLCETISTFVMYGPSEQLFKDIDEKCSIITDTVSSRLTNRGSDRCEFSTTWIYGCMVVGALGLLLLKYGETEAVTNFIVNVMSRIMMLF